MFILQVG
jgi:hypothetical protein